jgi:hypothetical protein
MTICGAAINLETIVLKFNSGAIFFADTVIMITFAICYIVNYVGP